MSLPPILQLTDGVTTLTLNDVTTYGLQRGWAPAVALLREGLLGSSQYDDVNEQIPLIVRGPSAAACYKNLQAVYTLLDQAERWANNEPVNPVVLRYMPQGSSLGVLQSVVVGSGVNHKRQRPVVTLPGSWDKAGMTYELDGVTLDLQRRGQWLFTTYAAENLLTNSAGDYATLGGWSLNLFHGNVGTIVANTTPTGANGGSVFTVTITTSAGIGNDRQVHSPIFGVTQGYNYNLSLECYVANGNLNVYLYSGTQGVISNQVTLTPATTGGHYPATQRTVAPAGLVATKSASDAMLIMELNISGTGVVFSFAEPLLTPVASNDWHRTSQEDTVTPASVAQQNGNIMVAQWPSALGHISPTVCQFVQNTGTMPPIGGFYLLAGDPSLLQVTQAAASMYGPSGWSRLTDVTNHSASGFILRATVVSGMSATSGTDASFFSATVPNTTRLGFFATLRNNSAATWQLQVALNVTGGLVVQTPITIIDGSTTNPRAVYLGELATRGVNDYTSMALVASAIGSPSGATLDFDRIWMIALDDPTARVINIGTLNSGGTVFSSLTLDPAALTAYQPSVGLQTAGGNAYPPYSGDPFTVSNGTKLAAAIIATSGNFWRWWGGGAAITTTLTATRQPAFLLPQ